MSYELKDYLNAINHEKKNLMDTDDELWEKKYPPFIINKCLAPFPDTIFLVNEMNKYHHLDKKLQFDFLLNSLRTRKRFTPWLKANKSMLKSIMVTTMKKQSLLLNYLMMNR